MKEKFVSYVIMWGFSTISVVSVIVKTGNIGSLMFYGFPLMATVVLEIL